MPLRGRVGRHGVKGTQCQNWKADQQAVVALLNKIPISDGGAEGTLNQPLVAGMAADGLCSSILYFENKHFPGRQTGFVEPGGSLLIKLEQLAAHPTPMLVPAPAGQWSGIKTKSVDDAVRKGLGGSDDLRLDHADAVNILRAILSDGTITAEELADLGTILNVSRSLEVRSRSMLSTLIGKINRQFKGRGPYRLSSGQQKFAADKICNFLLRNGRSAFPKLDRDAVGIGALMRVANPGLLDQDEASLCGPAAILFSLAADNPGVYAQYAIDLFEKGSAPLGRLTITPSTSCRNYLPMLSMDQVDWMTMASLRDSENWFYDYDFAERESAGITLPGELADWFRRAGYSDVRQETNLVFNKGTGAVDEASRLYGEGYRVCLFIGADMLKSWTQKVASTTAEHWVVLRSKIDRSNGKVKLTIFTWGEGNYQVPHGSDELSLPDFLGNFYGYIAAKP